MKKQLFSLFYNFSTKNLLFNPPRNHLFSPNSANKTIKTSRGKNYFQKRGEEKKIFLRKCTPPAFVFKV